MTSSHGELLDYTLIAQLLFSCCYLISSFFVFGNDYAGFNALLLSVFFFLKIYFTYVGIKKSPSRSLYGAVLGSGLILLVLSLQSAIFWGQYADCEKASQPSSAPTNSPAQAQKILMNSSANLDFAQRQLLGVECNHTSAMKSVCAFSVFMFLAYIVELGLLLKFKNEFLGSAPLDEGFNYSSVPVTIPYGDQASSRSGNTPATDL